MAVARAQGLSFPVPHCPSVGLSGFTMGGGIGWNYPQCGGVSTFSIMAAEIVTADGRRLLASPEQNADLYWAVRGAGPGFFGVVTRLFLQLYPLPGAIMASSYIFALDRLETVTSTLAKIRDEHDVRRVELIVLLMHHPDAPADASPEQSKICFFTAFAFEETEAEATAMLKPFADSALAQQCLVKMENQRFSYEELYERFFGSTIPPARWLDTRSTTCSPTKVAGRCTRWRTTCAPRPERIAMCLRHSTWNSNRRRTPASRGLADCFVGCYAIWDAPADDPVFFDWLARSLPLMDPFAVGHYVNEVEGRGHPERFRQCFSEANWERLQQLRATYDPQGVFHHYLGHS